MKLMHVRLSQGLRGVSCMGVLKQIKDGKKYYILKLISYINIKYVFLIIGYNA